MDLYSNKTIKAKIIIISLVSSGTALLLAGLIAIIFQLIQARQNIESELSVIAEMVALSTTPYVMFDDPKGAHEALMALGANPHILRASVLTAEGIVFARYTRMGDDLTTLEFDRVLHQAGKSRDMAATKPETSARISGLKINDTLEIIYPMITDGSRFGTVVVQMSLDHIRKMFLLLMIVSAGSLVVAILLVFWIASNLQKMITNPLLSLTRLMQTVSNERDYSVRAELTSYDEIGNLVDGFNGMLGQIQKRDRQLAEHRDGLELLVKAQTSELRESVEELKHARNVSEEANRAKSQFLSNMSHEIRTPMNAILGYTQLMQSNSAMTPELRDYSNVICRSGDHLLTLINDILEMSKIEAGRVTFNLENFDFHALFHDVMRIFVLRASEKGLNLNLAIDQEVPRCLRSDSQKVRQILINLLSNAIKFTECGGIIIRVTLAGRDESGGNTILTEVEDTGCGIAGEELYKVFAPFEQTGCARDKGGTGLGMSISRQYALLLNGDLTIKSEVEKGTTVSFTFRCDAAESFSMGIPVVFERRYVGMTPSSPVTKVLVVDDLKVNRDLLIKMLTSVGFVVEEASDGNEAVSLAHEWRPDIVLMDRRMPVMDGLDATIRIKSMPGEKIVPVIVVSASALEENRQEALATRADGFVRKPFREAEIMEEIRRLLPEIVYIYEDEDSPSGYNEFIPSTDFSDVVGALPSSLLVELRSFINEGDIFKFEEILVKRLKGQEPELAAHLKQLSDKYDYDSIIKVLYRSDDHG